MEGMYQYPKFDGCTRLQVNFPSLNVRYDGSNGDLMTQILVMPDTLSRNSGKETKDVICKVLVNKVNLKTGVGCMTDNAAKM